MGMLSDMLHMFSFVLCISVYPYMEVQAHGCTTYVPVCGNLLELPIRAKCFLTAHVSEMLLHSMYIIYIYCIYYMYLYMYVHT